MWQGTPLNIDNYIIAATTLGKGSAGTIYYARRRAEAGHDSNPTEIALKAVPDVDKLCAEVSILSSLSQHPNLVDFYGVCLMDHHTEDDDDDDDFDDEQEEPLAACAAIQFEFCNRSLDDAVAKQRFSEHSAHFVMVDLFRGLEHMHKLGLVHRDVKPESVLLTSDGTAKLTNFGISARLSDTRAMLVRCGTPGFVAPELFLGHKYGIKVDTFSSGVLLYYIISGCVPFGGSSVKGVVHRTITSRVNFRRSVCLERLSDACKEFIETLLEKHPDDRPASTDVLLLMCCELPSESDSSVLPRSAPKVISASSDSKDSDIREPTGKATMAFLDIRESAARRSTGRSAVRVSQSTEGSASMRVDVNVHDFDILEPSRPSAVLAIPSIVHSCKSMFRKLRYTARGKKTQQHDAALEDTAVLQAPKDAPVLQAGSPSRSATK